MSDIDQEGQEVAVVENKTAVVVDTTPAGLLAMLVQQGADIDKMKEFMDLQERWEANEAKKAYTKAMTKFRSKCPEIEKNRLVSFEALSGGNVSYKHATLASTIGQIKEVMSANGLSHSWKTRQDEKGITVTCIITHKDGHYEKGITVTCIITHKDGHYESTSLTGQPDASGKKNPNQQIASTVTILERYTLFAILGLASAEQDTDGALEVEFIYPDQVKQIEELIKKTDSDLAKFLKYLKVPNVEAIPAVLFPRAITMLERKLK